MLRFFCLCVIFVVVLAKSKEDYRVVKLEGLGKVKGSKYWDGEFYEFYGVPYATAPTGRDRYKAPLPPAPWENVMKANKAILLCEQVYYTEETDENEFVAGEADCLAAHLMVPKVATATNLVPVIVYIHSGGFSGGSGSMAKLHKMAQQDIIVVALNYRLGALGFACLGTENVPGNAALKDLVAGLKWVNKHIESFGGDPNKVTLAGYSVGATLAELVALTKEADGLFNRLMLDSSSALTPFAINREPIETARNIAKASGFEDSGTVKDLEEFLLEVPVLPLMANSRNFFLKNSTFGFAPCIENPNLPGALLTESPFDILKKGDYGNFEVFVGFSNMEGISRTSHFENWSPIMNENFSDFLPADLKFANDRDKSDFINSIKKEYFHGEEVSLDTLKGYVDYFSDSMFKYAIMRSAKLHAARKPIYLYEFTYVGKLNTQHLYMDRLTGASHRDASAYVLDFYDWTRNYTDMDMRDRMVFLWSDFVKFGNPTAYESSLVKVKWQKYSNEEPKYLDIGYDLVMKNGLLSKSFEFWDKVYQKHYWTPTAPDLTNYKPTQTKSVKPKVTTPDDAVPATDEKKATKEKEPDQKDAKQDKRTVEKPNKKDEKVKVTVQSSRVKVEDEIINEMSE